jgi:hypothetical protein
MNWSLLFAVVGGLVIALSWNLHGQYHYLGAVEQDVIHAVEIRGFPPGELAPFDVEMAK